MATLGILAVLAVAVFLLASQFGVFAPGTIVNACDDSTFVKLSSAEVEDIMAGGSLEVTTPRMWSQTIRGNCLNMLVVCPNVYGWDKSISYAEFTCDNGQVQKLQWTYSGNSWRSNVIPNRIRNENPECKTYTVAFVTENAYQVEECYGTLKWHLERPPPVIIECEPGDVKVDMCDYGEPVITARCVKGQWELTGDVCAERPRTFIDVITDFIQGLMESIAEFIKV